MNATTSQEQDVLRLTVKPSQAKSCIIKAFQAKKVPMLHGSPAIGKSSIVHQVAEQFNLKVIDLRLGQTEPTDMLGFPYSNLQTGKSGYLPMETFPIEGDSLPIKADGTTYAGWILFLDEITSARPETQAAAYKLILDRMTGIHKLHEKVLIVAAGNLESDNAVVFPMSTALQTRMIHLELKLDQKEWMNWALEHKIDHRIMDYIEWRPDNLYSFSPDHTNFTYASPRTWEFTDHLLKTCSNQVKDPDFLFLASGSVTEGIARELIEFCDIYASLPKIADILIAPKTVHMPDEPNILFALSGALASQITEKNATDLLPYILRMPVEFQVVTLRRAIKLLPNLRANAAITDWVVNHGAALF